MNSNQVKGSVKDAAGKLQEKAGAAMGSTKQEGKGMAKQVEGKAQKAAGDVQQGAKDADKSRP